MLLLCLQFKLPHPTPSFLPHHQINPSYLNPTRPPPCFPLVLGWVPGLVVRMELGWFAGGRMRVWEYNVVVRKVYSDGSGWLSACWLWMGERRRWSVACGWKRGRAWRQWVVGLPSVAVVCKRVGKPMCRVAMSKELRVYSKMNNGWTCIINDNFHKIYPFKSLSFLSTRFPSSKFQTLGSWGGCLLV